MQLSTSWNIVPKVSVLGSRILTYKVISYDHIFSQSPLYINTFHLAQKKVSRATMDVNAEADDTTLDSALYQTRSNFNGDQPYKPQLRLTKAVVRYDFM